MSEIFVTAKSVFQLSIIVLPSRHHPGIGSPEANLFPVLIQLDSPLRTISGRKGTYETFGVASVTDLTVIKDLWQSKLQLVTPSRVLPFHCPPPLAFTNQRLCR
jgi:hypothetical protein